MKKRSRQTDKYGIAEWIGKHRHSIIHLSDSPTFNLTLAIYREIIAMNPIDRKSANDREKDLSDFTDWFLKLGSFTPALEGVMWMLLEIGEKVVANEGAGQLTEDARLSRLLLAFMVISRMGSKDPLAKRYYGMVANGWANCSHDSLKEALFRSFVATLAPQGLHELAALGKSQGLSASELEDSLRLMAKANGPFVGSCPLRDAA